MNWLRKLFTKKPPMIVHTEVNLLIFHMKGVRTKNDLEKVKKIIKDSIMELREERKTNPNAFQYLLIPSENVIKIEAFNIKPNIDAEIKTEKELK